MANRLNVETWKPVPVKEYADYYEVSTLGRVRNIHKRLLALVKHPLGYLRVDLYNGETNRLLYVHRLVAMAFNPPTDANVEVNHKDGNKENNRAENLEWVTPSENQKHAFRLGLRVPPFGEKSPVAKLTNKEALEIRRLRGSTLQRDLARRFNVSKGTICQVQLGRRYAYA